DSITYIKFYKHKNEILSKVFIQDFSLPVVENMNFNEKELNLQNGLYLYPQYKSRNEIILYAITKDTNKNGIIDRSDVGEIITYQIHLEQYESTFKSKNEIYSINKSNFLQG